MRCIRVLRVILLFLVLLLLNGCGTSLLDFCRPRPSITAINPATVKAGTADFTLVITGTDFHSDSTVSLNGTIVASTIQSATQMSTTVPATLVVSTGTIAILVNSPPGGGSPTSPTGCGGGNSNTVTLTITP